MLSALPLVSPFIPVSLCHCCRPPLAQVVTSLATGWWHKLVESWKGWVVWRVLRKGSTAGLVSSVLAGSSGLVGQFGALELSAENGYNRNFGTLFSTLKQ